MTTDTTTTTPAPATPMSFGFDHPKLGAVRLGTLAVRLNVHGDDDGDGVVFCLQARDVRFGFPRAENVEQALDLLGFTACMTAEARDVFVSALNIEGNTSGFWARCKLCGGHDGAGAPTGIDANTNPIVVGLLNAARERYTARLAALAAATTAEA